eukprot:TRINITY_DN24846_c0_g1_i1.p1 TRINITY_DN24846_c0_g1~~TRINITY_DN24846_c0_g1_i1.p1  ORF type:complete len:354 (+),score=66.12 TRINITY_DN24846_c0_g1_i1:56-1117(+)
MSPLPRRVSVSDVNGTTGIGKILPQPMEADCGCCSLSFREGGPGLHGLGVLEISPRSQGKSEAEGERRSSLVLSSMLLRVLSTSSNFAVLYDFRSQAPELRFVDSLCLLWKEHAHMWAGRMKFAALLVTDNLFHAAASGGVVDLLQAQQALSCPFVLCHAKAAAEEFFRVGLYDLQADEPDVQGDAPFVSVVEVEDDVNASPHACFRGGCRACLAPLRPGSGDAEHTFHMLPNGDVRVIQSAPGDVVVKREAPKELGPKAAGDKVCGAAATATMRSVKFQYSTERLRKLIGMYFHLGELVIDAEYDSILRCGAGAIQTPLITPEKASRGCLGGMQSLLHSYAQLLFGFLEGVD